VAQIQARLSHNLLRQQPVLENLLLHFRQNSR
jgi:hypothetical protein